jgi:serine protease Do
MTRALAAVMALGLLLGVVAPEAATRWGWLGVRIRDLSEQEMNEISRKHGIREGYGALIVDVMKETPADAAGLRNGDLVVAFKDRPVVDTRALQRYIASTSIGEVVTLTVLRPDAGRRPVEVRIGPMPEEVAADRVSAEYGFLLREPEAPAGAQHAPRPARPPTVSVVMPGGRAEAAGLRVGDVLVEIDGKPVGSEESVREALLGLSERGPLSLVVRRDRQRLSFVLREPRGP